MRAPVGRQIQLDAVRRRQQRRGGDPAELGTRVGRLQRPIGALGDFGGMRLRGVFGVRQSV